MEQRCVDKRCLVQTVLLQLETHILLVILCQDEPADEEDEAEAEGEASGAAAPPPSKPAPSKPASKAKRRKKKGKGGAEDGAGKQAAPAAAAGAGEEDLDKLLAEFQVQEQVRLPAALAGRQSTHTMTAHPHHDSWAVKVAIRRQSTHTLTAGLSRWPHAGSPPTP